MEDKTLGELGEVIQGACFVSGQANGYNAGWQSATKLIEEEMGKAFVDKKDSFAFQLRDLRDSIAKAGEKRVSEMSKYAAENRVREEAAFAELDKRQKTHGVVTNEI